MKCLVIILFLILVIPTMAIDLPVENEQLSDANSTDVNSFDIGEDEDYPNTDDAVAEDTSPLGEGRFLRGRPHPHPHPRPRPRPRPRRATTCNIYPRICRARGSPGPDCCKKSCVNVDVDRSNCGSCHHKCRFLEICCKGRCVNPLVDRKHCGGCHKKCKKGDRCSYGMCTYA